MDPLTTPFIPNVMMIEGIFNTVIPTPLASPTMAPTAKADKTATAQELPSLSIVADTAADKPSIAPIDTSISPLIMTKAIPTAKERRQHCR